MLGVGITSLSLDGQAELASGREQNDTLGELFPATLPASLNVLALDWGTLNNKMIGLKFILPLQRKLQDSPWRQNFRSVSFGESGFSKSLQHQQCTPERRKTCISGDQVHTGPFSFLGSSCLQFASKQKAPAPNWVAVAGLFCIFLNHLI